MILLPEEANQPPTERIKIFKLPLKAIPAGFSLSPLSYGITVVTFSLYPNHCPMGFLIQRSSCHFMQPTNCKMTL